MTQTSQVAPARVDELAYLGWPPAHAQEIGPWVARATSGVTRRANSVLTSPRSTGRPGQDAVPDFELDAAIAAVEAFYREHDLPPVFQLSDAAVPPGLAESLAQRGYRREGETLAQAASIEALRARLADVVASGSKTQVCLGDQPDEEWLRMWLSVDGRGWPDGLQVARQIMTGSAAVYASVHDAHGVSAGARLALVDDWGVLFALVVRPDARRRGLATGVLAALVAEAERRGIRRLLLQVLATSHGALAFYESLGFETVSHYRYFTR